jgi:hypothetical protein
MNPIETIRQVLTRLTLLEARSVSSGGGGGGVSDGNKGSITVTSGGSTWTINSGAVTNDMLAGSITLGKLTGLGAGVSTALAVASDTSGGFLTAGAGGTLPISRGGTGATTVVAAREAMGIIRRILGSDARATSTTPVTAADLTFPVEAGKIYRVDLSLVVASIAGTSPNNPGYQVSMTYPTTSRTGFGHSMVAHQTVVKLPNLGATFTGLNPNTTGNPNGTLGISGHVYLRPTGSGNVVFNSYHQTAAQTGSIGLLAGSLVIVTEV